MRAKLKGRKTRCPSNGFKDGLQYEGPTRQMIRKQKGPIIHGDTVVSSLGAVFEGIILTHHIITSYFTIINPFHVFISRIIHYLHFMYPSHPHSSYHSSSPFFFASFFPSKKFPHHSFFTIISSLFELCPKVSHRI